MGSARPRPKDITEGSLLRALLFLAASLLVQNLVQVLQQVIDLFWLGRLSSDAVAAVGLALPVIALLFALVISTPVSVVSGITSAAKNGVLIKGGNHLETMGEVDAVALDKTGTLTKGELAVTDVIPLGNESESDLLRYGAGLEQRSEHPIAEAILSYITERELADIPAVSDFESLTGKGIRGEIGGETYYAGKPALFEELGFDLSQEPV